MGADEKSILKKCGEILIKINMKNKRNKVFSFNCTFCNENCDQLKKFSQHLEEKHIEDLSKEFKDKTVLYVPAVKAEDLKTIDVKDDLNEIDCVPLHEDPLETVMECKQNFLEVEIKEEEIQEQMFEMDYEDHDQQNDYQDCIEDNEDNSSDNDSSHSEYNGNRSTQRSKRKRKKVIKYSDEKNFRMISKQEKKNLKKSQQIKIDEKELCIALLEAFEKHPSLWKVKEREVHNNINQKNYEIIANEVNEKIKSNISCLHAKSHIRRMRREYASEMEKKNNGEEYELPWYAEHMKFLQENIEVLMKGRVSFEKYCPLKTMDESELLILIDVYKKYDCLWQVNNIAFGSRSKKEEVFKQMLEDLNQNHNQNITLGILHRRVNYMMRIYSENKEHHLKCEMKNRKFKPSSPLYEKMSFLSDAVGPFKCSQCNEIIKKYEHYHIHVAKHNDTNPFQCPLCQRPFHRYNNYLTHARRHLELNKHICRFCDRCYPTTTELALHERSHTGEHPYLCQICGAKFRAANGYDNHMRRHENRFRYICHICNHGFNHSHELNDHVKAHLNIRDIVCKICGKTFTATKFLKNHMNIHSEVKRYKCQVCGKAFAQNAGLRQHRKQHQPLAALRKKESSLNIETASTFCSPT